MSTEVLRQAAETMRARAKAAPDQPRTMADVIGVWLGSRFHLTMPPDVALAVADWLEAESQSHTHIPGVGRPFVYDMPGMDTSPAMRVARAYLGGVA